VGNPLNKCIDNVKAKRRRSDRADGQTDRGAERKRGRGAEGAICWEEEQLCSCAKGRRAGMKMIMMKMKKGKL
jgi:hypothetical protein